MNKKAGEGWRRDMGRIRQGLDGLVGRATARVREVVEVAQEEGLKAAAAFEQGVYRGKGAPAIIDGLVNDTLEHGKKALEALRGRYERAYSTIEAKMFTGGRFDADKASQFLNDRFEGARLFGKQTYDRLMRMAKDERERVLAEYRKIAPTQEEMETRYAGIGTKYDGVLLRHQFEGCLEFHHKADSKMTKGTRYKTQILEDLKACAAEDKMVLIGYYASAREDANAEKKMTIVLRYL